MIKIINYYSKKHHLKLSFFHNPLNNQTITEYLNYLFELYNIYLIFYGFYYTMTIIFT
jgi:hypothetical protein